MAMGKAKQKVLLPQLQTLISIGSLFLMVANMNMALSQTTHFVVPPSLTFQGDAFVPNDTSFFRLTNSQWVSAGRIMYSKPFTFWGEGKQVEFETKITFNITSIQGPLADGIAFFIAPVNSTIPAFGTGGNLGLFGIFGDDSIFAVEFDTYANGWDPPCRHIGIDVSSRKSVATQCLNVTAGEEVTLSVKYDAAGKKITVEAHQEAGEYYNLSYKLDLSTILKKEVQVGISASTGLNSALHDIYYWDFIANMIYDSDATVDGAGIRQLVST